MKRKLKPVYFVKRPALTPTQKWRYHEKVWKGVTAQLPPVETILGGTYQTVAEHPIRKRCMPLFLVKVSYDT